MTKELDQQVLVEVSMPIALRLMLSGIRDFGSWCQAVAANATKTDDFEES